MKNGNTTALTPKKNFKNGLKIIVMKISIKNMKRKMKMAEEHKIFGYPIGILYSFEEDKQAKEIKEEIELLKIENNRLKKALLFYSYQFQ